MRYPLEPLDCVGNKIAVGDNVVFFRASENLLRGLPDEDQEAINAEVGNVLNVLDIDEFGYAELEFFIEGDDLDQTNSHTIWVEPHCLKKV